MPKGTIDIVVEPGIVRVHYDAISEFPHRRFYVGLAFLMFIIAADCAMFFFGHKHGETSLWQDMHAYPISSSRILFPIFLTLTLSAIFIWHVARVIQVMYPGAEKLECNRTTMTISRLRWLDWENKDWISESYSLDDVSRIRFGVIVSGRGNSTYGLKFRAARRNYKLFPNLTTRQVGKILGGLEALGADTERRRKALQRKLKNRSVRA